MQKALPGVRTNIVSEQCRVVTAPNPVVPSLLLVSPAGRQVGYSFNVVVDDGLVTQTRSNDAKAVISQPRNQARQSLRRDHRQRMVVHRPCPSSAVPERTRFAHAMV